MWAPLHVRSHASLGNGVASPEQLVRLATGYGYAALGLTDVESLQGQVRLHVACRRAGLRPITGLELRSGFRAGRVPALAARAGGRVLLLARDREGYRSLCRIVARRRLGAEATPQGRWRDPVRCVEDEPRGLFVLTDHAPTLERLAASPALDPAAVRALLVRPAARGRETALLSAARANGVRVVADLDASLARPGQAELQRLLAATRAGTTTARLRAAGWTPGRPLLSPGRVRDLFADVPAALEEAERVAEACRLDLLSAARVRTAGSADGAGPAGGGCADAPDGADGAAVTRLRRRCEAALAERGPDGGAYRDRLERELRAIAATGHAGAFLLAGEVVDRCRDAGIPWAVRGSAAGSLVVHLLGIGAVDPVSEGLLFERFLHERRGEPPDIDIDVCSRRRDELLDRLARRYGPDRVAMVGAPQAYGRRGALREGLSALGVAPERRDRLLRALPATDLEGDEEAWEAAVRRLASALGPRVPLHLIGRLARLPRHMSAHPSGLIVGDRPLADALPLERAPKGVPVTQYDGEGLARLGIVKLDLLGNRCLTELGETVRRVAERPPRAASPSASRTRRLAREGLAGIPAADPATARTLSRGDTVGCFQVESPAVRAVLRQMPVRSRPDVTVALALVRPGPSSAGAREAYLRRAHGREPARAPHPRLQPLLEGSLGVLLFEEDLLRVVASICGVSAARADAFRVRLERALDDPARLRPLRRAFLRRAREGGLAVGEADRLWSRLCEFASYAFSRAHASSTARLAWQAAYLRTHAPTEFACSVLEHHRGAYPLRSLASEVVRWGVRLLPPCVNRSAAACKPAPCAGGAPERRPAPVRLGLGRLRALPEGRVARLLEERERGGPFADVRDLVARVRPAAPELRALVLSGACDQLAPLSAEAYPFAHRELLGGGAAARASTARAEGGEQPPDLRRYRALVRARNELATLGMHPSAHPMEVLRAEAERAGCLPARELPASAGRRVRFAGVLAASRRHRTGEGRLMQFLTLEDESGLVEAVLFPAAWRRRRGALGTPGPYLLEGAVEAARGGIQLRVERALPFHARGPEGRDRAPSGASRRRPGSGRGPCRDRSRAAGP